MTEINEMTFGWFESLGWQTAFGPNISPDLPAQGAARQVGVPDAEKFILEAGI